MEALLSQLGISGKLLVAQAVNFAVVLVVLNIVLYRPLTRMMEDRRKKIELGLHSTEIAEKRLGEIEKERVTTIAGAEREALHIVADAQKTGTAKLEQIVAGAEKRAEDLLKGAMQVAAHRRQEDADRLIREAGAIMKEAIAKAVEMDPEKIDERFVKKAADIMKKKVAAL